MKGFFGVVDNCTCFYSIIDPIHDSVKPADELHYVMNTPRLPHRFEEQRDSGYCALIQASGERKKQEENAQNLQFNYRSCSDRASMVENTRLPRLFLGAIPHWFLREGRREQWILRGCEAAIERRVSGYPDRL